MADVKPASVADTKSAAAYFVALHGVFGVNEDGFVTVESEQLHLGKDDNRMPVSIYNDPMPDPSKVGAYWVLNPFSTKAQQTHAQRALIRSYKVSMANYTVTLLKTVINAALVSKKAKVKHDLYNEELDLTPEVRELTALKTEGKKSIASEIDVKMFDEICNIDTPKVIEEFFSSVYVTAKLRSTLNIPFLSNDDWFVEACDVKLRKKTVEVLKTLLLAIFGVKDGADFRKVYSSEAEIGEPARFASQIRNVLKVHAALNKFYAELSEDMLVDLAILQEHIDNIVAYTKRAKLLTVEKVTPVKTAEAKETTRDNKQVYRPTLTGHEEPRQAPSLQSRPTTTGRPSPLAFGGGHRPNFGSTGRALPTAPAFNAGAPIIGRGAPAPRSFGRSPVSDFGSNFSQVRRNAPFISRR